MTEHAIEQVIVTYDRSWGAWPSTPSTDYGAALSWRGASQYKREGETYNVRSRYYPIHAAYARARVLHLPGNRPDWYVDNTVEFDPRVVAQMLKDLWALSRECPVLVWKHAFQCPPEVAKELRSMFALAVLEFGDDCPGSSETKSYPVARYFDALVYNMLVRSYDGEDTASAYRAQGVACAYFQPLGPSSGTAAWIADNGFSIVNKASELATGALAPLLVFVGTIGSDNPARMALLGVLGGLGAVGGVSTRLHGHGLPGGLLEPLAPLLGGGYTCAPLYAQATLGLNFPISSLFNCRLFDYALLGVPMIAYDRNGELARMGLVAGRHFIPFDGSAFGLDEIVRAWAPRHREIAQMALAFREGVEAIRAKHDAWTVLYYDHRERLP